MAHQLCRMFCLYCEMQSCMSQNRLIGAPPSLSPFKHLLCAKLGSNSCASRPLRRDSTRGWVNGWHVPFKKICTGTQTQRKGNLRVFYKDKHRWIVNFSSWEMKGSSHTEIAASVSKRNEHLAQHPRTELNSGTFLQTASCSCLLFSSRGYRGARTHLGSSASDSVSHSEYIWQASWL